MRRMKGILPLALRTLSTTVFVVAVGGLSTASGLTAAKAATLTPNDGNGNATGLTGMDSAGNTYNVTLNPLPAVRRGAGINDEELDALTRDSPGWTFVNTALGLPGDISINKYDAFVYSPILTDFVTVVYLGNFGKPQAGNLAERLANGTSVLHWVQFIYTNAPCGSGVGVPYVDPQCPKDDDRPFYWKEDERTHPDWGAYTVYQDGDQNVWAGITFKDRPRRSFGQGGINWRAILVLVEWDKATTVRFHDAIEWGFRFSCATGTTPGSNLGAGIGGDKEPSESSGVNPSPVCEGPVGGVAELPADGPASLPIASGGSGPSAAGYAAISGVTAAAAVALAAGAWYTRGRWLR